MSRWHRLRRAAPNLKPMRRISRASLPLVVLLAIGAPCYGAAATDVFTVSGIEVDETADTAAAARDRAIAEGQKEALKLLFDRIVIESDLARLPVPDGNTVTDMVRDFEVVQEKTSAVRYLATLNVRFKASQVRSYLRGQGVAFAETRSRPVLVLPVYEHEGAYSLWDDPNPWRDAWLGMPPQNGLVPLIRPKGDLYDASLIGPEQVLRSDEARLNAIAQHYGAASILIAVAGFDGGIQGTPPNAGGPALKVTSVQVGTGRFEQTRLETFWPGEGEETAELIQRAARSIAADVQERWKRENQLRFDAGNRVEVSVRIDSLSDWQEIKQRLDGIALIRTTDVVYLSLREARLRIEFIGETEQLTLALAQNDLILEQGSVAWVLRRGGHRRGKDDGFGRRGNEMQGGTPVAPPNSPSPAVEAP